MITLVSMPAADHDFINLLHDRALADDFPKPVAVFKQCPEAKVFLGKVFGSLLDLLFPQRRLGDVLYEAVEVGDFAIGIANGSNAQRAGDDSALLSPKL